jgi:hypothetical protein
MTAAFEIAKSLVRVLRHSRRPQSLVGEQKKSERCFVLGNGPSLGQDMRSLEDLRGKGEIFCVNGFAESELYQQLKPNYYVFADAAYWSSDISPDIKSMRERLFHCIRHKTIWRLTIYVPFEGKVFLENAIASKNIDIVGYNNVPLNGKSPAIYKLYDWGLGLPPVNNVLVATLYFAVRHGYKEIILLGADHSWHETIFLNGQNEVCMRDTHFYNPNAPQVPWRTGREDGRTFTMPLLFDALGKMFAGHWSVQGYAKSKSISIVNASSKTYVDAYPRMDLKMVKNRHDTDTC